jgi:AAA15 family ATPase/GTPase
MLLQFNVSNFLSIKDEITLTAFANASKEHEDNLIILGRERILPSLALYGANAAG